jgi:NADH-quinone oxidoreductase subunit M
MFLVIALASLGLPLLNGFIGEFLILQGAFSVNTATLLTIPNGMIWAAFAVSGIVLGAAYLLWLYQRTMFGSLDKPENQNLKDLNWRERWTLIPIIVLCIWIGVYPKPFLKVIEVPVQNIVERIHPEMLAGVEVPSSENRSLGALSSSR